MKKLLSILVLTLLVAACTKKSTTEIISNPIPAFTVNGLANITLTNGAGSYYDYVSQNISVQYNDSTQEMVTLSLSALPAGITMDTTWTTSGYPSFTTTLTLYDTTVSGATPGTYNMTLTATGAISGTKTFTFKIIIKTPPPCSSEVTGKYINCYSCNSGAYYADSVYADPTVANKIWFSNFNNTGYAAYGILNCTYGDISIPLQTLGGITYSGSGNFSSHSITIDPLSINSTVSCYLYEQ